MKKLSILFLLGVIVSLVSCKSQYPDLKDGLYAEFNTNQGAFVAKLYYKRTPLTVANFVSLAEGTNPSVDSTYKGKPFYNGIVFHRVIADFMIQAGDPSATGAGGPGYKFTDEIVDSLTFAKKGVLAMANAGPDTNGSQFFITVKPTPWLNGRHTIFGHIVQGQTTVDSISTLKTNKPRNRPVEDVVIESLNIIRKGKDAKNFNAAKVFSEKMESAAKAKAIAEKKIEETKKAAAAHFAKIKPEAKALNDGLLIYFDKKGGGVKPKNGQKVTLNYEGYLPDGTLFDSNIKEVAEKYNILNPQRLKMGGYSPMTSVYGPKARFIPGFKEGLQQMSVGDVATVFIPSHLGYGKQGAGDAIPPNADLIFKITLVEIVE